MTTEHMKTWLEIDSYTKGIIRVCFKIILGTYN